MITWMLDAYGRDEVAEEQMSALLMAIFLRGLSEPELDTWTTRMIESGERLDLRGLSRPTVDKHSTGGVGDKISLILAPLVAACGAAVPQLSGRGLGHTGGTLDKLESIPGWRATLSNTTRSWNSSRRVGAVICAAGAGLAPIDRRLYSLRDVTGTVERSRSSLHRSCPKRSPKEPARSSSTSSSERVPSSVNPNGLSFSPAPWFVSARRTA